MFRNFEICSIIDLHLVRSHDHDGSKLVTKSHDQSGPFKGSLEQAQNSNVINHFSQGANGLVISVVKCK